MYPSLNDQFLGEISFLDAFFSDVDTVSHCRNQSFFVYKAYEINPQ